MALCRFGIWWWCLLPFSSMRHDKRAPLVLFSTAFLALAADQLTKELIRHNILVNEAIPEHGAFRLVNVSNDGIIFGLGAPLWFAITMPIVLVLAVLLAYYWYSPLGGKTTNICVGLFVGGTVGNWVDRLRFHAVTDFIDVRLKGDVHWFTFNLADVAILVAIIVFVMAIFGLWPGRAAKREQRTPPSDSPPGG